MSKFKILSLFTSLLFLYLFYLLFFSADQFFSDLGIEATETAYFMCRRAAMFMLGISVLMFFARNIPSSPARQAISISIAVTMLGLALTGMYEFNRGFVSNDIFISIIVETILCVSFLYIWFTDRNDSNAASSS